MSFISDFFLAEPNITPSYNAESNYINKCEFSSLSVLEVAGIMAVLNGGDALDLADDEFELLDFDDEDTSLYAVSDEFIQLLSSIKQNEIADIAEKCAVETTEEINWQASDFIPVIKALRSLSIKAKEQSQGMYFWNSI